MHRLIVNEITDERALRMSGYWLIEFLTLGKLTEYDVTKWLQRYFARITVDLFMSGNTSLVKSEIGSSPILGLLLGGIFLSMKSLDSTLWLLGH